MLIDALIEDLNDPTIRGPGLYGVVRGVINDHKEDVNILPQNTIKEIEDAMSSAAPFKIEAI
jgi:hypothetical protein|tara:strand:+ start:112 stop:297 length:186 start_codon:yes stop_codon:yes gene_type:complete